MHVVVCIVCALHILDIVWPLVVEIILLLVSPIIGGSWMFNKI